MLRDGYARTHDIETAADSLVNWCDEFVGNVHDHQGNQIYSDWLELLGTLREVLKHDGPKR